MANDTNVNVENTQGEGGKSTAGASQAHRWGANGGRKRWFITQLREGYARMETDTIGDACEVWLEVWREVAAVANEMGEPTLLEVSQACGLGDILPNWFDDWLNVGRWLEAEDSAAQMAALEEVLAHFSERFTDEPTSRSIHVACTCADLLRARDEIDSSEAAYAMIRASFPDRAQVLERWVDCRLDCAERVDMTLMRACEKLLVSGLADRHVDEEEHNLAWQLESLRSDMHRAAAFGGKGGTRWPYFEVFNWPAPIALHEAEPELEDAFFLRYGEYLGDFDELPWRTDATT